jgi:hypothetical protein
MAFKNERRVIEKRTVFIGGPDEAFAIIADWHRDVSFPDFKRKYGCTEDEAKVLAYAAAQYLLSYYARTGMNDDVREELGVNRCPDSPAEPTWTSSKGDA